MLGGIWNFVKRHKRKFIFAGALIGGGILLKSYARRKFREWEEQQMNEYIELMRREQHFESTQQTCNSTVLSFVKNLREQVIRNMDSESLTMALKSRPENKIQIWEDLKIVAFSRALTVVYSISMLVVLLRIKLSILGGYMYHDTMTNVTGSTSSSCNIGIDLQQQYLGNVQYFLGPGLEKLSMIVQEQVQKLMGPVSLKENYSLKDLENLLAKIRYSIEGSGSNGSTFLEDVNKLCLPLNNPNTGVYGDEGGEKFNIMMNETRDVLENSDCQIVFKQILDLGFSQLVDSFAEFYNRSLQTDISVALRSSSEVLIPLAKLIPVANGTVHSICSDEGSQFLLQILMNESLKSWSANIYEAFVSQGKADNEIRYER